MHERDPLYNVYNVFSLYSLPGAYSTRRVMAALVALLILGAPAALLASGAAAQVGPVPRWPLIVAGLALAIVGFGAGRVMRMWHELSRGQRAARVVGFAAACLGVFLTMTAVTQAPPLYSSTQALPWHKTLPSAQRAQEIQQAPMMVDFSASWCTACHELEAEVFNNPTVSPRLRQEVVLLKVDFDAETPEAEALRNRFEVSGLPTVVFINARGEKIPNASFEGKLTPDEFQRHLNAAISGEQGQREGAFAKTLGERGLLAALLLVFLAGVASSLTPCVYPLIPITISLFGARESESTWRSFTLSLTYVLGIAITYSALGVAAAMLGTVFGGAMQHPAVVLGVAGMFIALGLSSLGVFHLRLPGDLQTRLSQQGGAGYAGALIMGLVAGVIAAPCVGPIVAGVLVYVAQQQDVVLGWLMLMTFALGMGMLFLVLGTFSSLLQRLPRAGTWMEGVKSVFGVVFLAMAVFYAQQLISPIRGGVQALWALLAGQL